MSGLRIENARLEERIANTERRADELSDQATPPRDELARLAQKKPEPKELPKPRQRPAPRSKPTPKKPS
jgi:hypothetical protein